MPQCTTYNQPTFFGVSLYWYSLKVKATGACSARVSCTSWVIKTIQ